MQDRHEMLRVFPCPAHGGKAMKSFLIGMLLVTALATGGCLDGLQTEEEFFQQFEVEPGTGLEVYNRNGKVEIKGGEGHAVEVWATKKSFLGKSELEKVEIRVEEEEQSLVVKSEYLRENARVSVQYQLRVPEGVEVKKAESSNGNVVIKEVKGNAAATTSNGKVEISGVEGTVEARTSNGSIQIDGVEGLRGARTSNGSIEAELPSLEQDLEIRTSNGSITLSLAPEIGAELEARTSNGQIKTQGLQLQESEVESTLLRGRLGEGGPRLQVKTSNGSIELIGM